jgi:hypothetical protein
MPKNFEISDKSEKVLEKFEMEEEKKTTSEESKPKIKEDTKKEAPPTEELLKEIEGDTNKEKKPKKENKKKEKKKKEKKVKDPSKKFNWKKLIFPAVATLTLVGIGLFYYFGIYKVRPRPLSEVFSFDEMYIVSEENKNTFTRPLPLLSAPQEPRTEESPLNGMLFSKKEMDKMMNRRPVAVMINNHVDARPLSGLNSADIVIEANVESGITRLLGIFWSKAPGKVGPIRSLRQNYLEWASEYDPLLIHDGCAKTDDPRTNACGNVYTYGIKTITTTGAWRSNEDGRVAPHNEYSSVTNAWEYGEKMDWDQFPSSIVSWDFKRDADIKDRGDKTDVKTIFHTRLRNDGLYDTEWVYDKSTNSYFRRVGGKPDMDTETNTQVTAKVVILQEVKVVPSGDDKGRLITTTIGQGDATILQDGKIIDATWKKSSRTARTTYFDSANNPIQFNRGRIWIAMIPHSDGEFAIIEQ